MTTFWNNIMKLNHFSLILRFLHLNDSANYFAKGHPGHDPLYKLRPFMGIFAGELQHFSITAPLTFLTTYSKVKPVSKWQNKFSV